MARYRAYIAIALAAGCAALMTQPAAAYVMVSRTPVNFTGGSVSLGFKTGDITFNDNANRGFSFSPVSVSTTNGGVFGSFLGTPDTSFDPIRGFDPDPSITISQATRFASSSTPVVIPFSVNPFIIALADTTADGTHYGYGRFSGRTLLSYGFETVAGAPVTINNASLAAVPLPASAPLLGAGLFALGAAGYMAKRKRAAAA